MLVYQVSLLDFLGKRVIGNKQHLGILLIKSIDEQLDDTVPSDGH